MPKVTACRFCDLFTRGCDFSLTYFVIPADIFRGWALWFPLIYSIISLDVSRLPFWHISWCLLQHASRATFTDVGGFMYAFFSFFSFFLFLLSLSLRFRWAWETSGEGGSRWATKPKCWKNSPSASRSWTRQWPPSRTSWACRLATAPEGEGG